jgi:Putative peptidoglycan binding domain
VQLPLRQPYVFDAASYRVHVVARGVPAPARGVVVDAQRLRFIFFDGRNTWERERLLRDLELPDLRPRALDLADRLLIEDRLYRTLHEQFAVYEVPLRTAANPPETLQWFPPAKASGSALSWIGLWLVDQSGEAIACRPYRVIAGDGQSMAGVLNDQGAVNLQRLEPGTCQVFCPDVQPHGSLTYTVQQGDHISGIALAFGFEDYALVWSRPENAALRAQRTKEHELVEGDSVFIPPLSAAPVMKPTGADHVFTLRRSPLKLRIKLLGLTLKPMASTACRLEGVTLTTDGDGLFEVALDKSTRSQGLVIGDQDLDLLPGSLAPSDVGWMDRLYNLGFLFDPSAEEGDFELRLALEDFQAEAGLPVTGDIDDATKASLLQMHGD